MGTGRMKTHPVTHIAILCILASPLLAIDQHYFSNTVYPALQKAGCQGCHNPDGVAAGTRLHFPDPGAP